MKKGWMINVSDLDEKQLEVFNSILDKSCIVTGCAGSGKSALALMKAARIQKERGDNYKIIVFTKALCKYMDVGRVVLPNEVVELHGALLYHKQWKLSDNKMADYIIVDEIQDFDKDEIQEFITATNKYFYFLGDTAQTIYEGINYCGKIKNPMSIANISNLLIQQGVQLKKIDLYYNYRLPVHVAEFVQYVGINLPAFDPDKYKSKEKSIPYILEYNDEHCQVSAIKELYENNKDKSNIAVLLSKKNQIKWFCYKLECLNVNYEVKCDDTDTINFDTSNLKVMTYHSAKGLQFETVILPFMGAFHDDNGTYRKALYVAMTRTYKDLYIMYSRVPLPQPLCNIPNNLYKTSTYEDIDML